jgi:hypothetical protein
VFSFRDERKPERPQFGYWISRNYGIVAFFKNARTLMWLHANRVLFTERLALLLLVQETLDSNICPETGCRE